MPTRPSDRTGIYPHGQGWRAVVSQGKSQPQIIQHFPKETPFAVMQAWRADQQAQHRVTRKIRASRGTFAGDAARYLASVSALPTIKERQRHIGLWVDVFGTRHRQSITAADIRRQRDKWLAERRSATDARPLSPGTVNRRLRALSNLWTVLDGPKADNPVRHVEEAHEPESLPRDLDYQTIARILEEVPDLGRAPKGQARSDVSLTKIRLRILAYTGMPAKQLMRLTPKDVDLAHGLVTLPARKKGRGRSAALLPLLPQAIDAFRELAEQRAFGPFSTSSMWKTFARAAQRAGVTNASPYSLRHSFLSVVLDVTGSLDAVMAFAQHASPSMARRYTQRAAAKLLKQHASGVERHIGKSLPGAKRKTPTKTAVGESISARVKDALKRKKQAENTGAPDRI